MIQTSNRRPLPLPSTARRAGSGCDLRTGGFTVLSGIPGQFDNPMLTKAIERVAKAAKAAGKLGNARIQLDHAKRLPT